MDKISLLLEKKNRTSNLAVDGLIYGLVSGGAMFICLATFSFFLGENPGGLLVRFSTSQLITPLQGLLGHLAISATYGVLFGAVIQPLVLRIKTPTIVGWLVGAVYGALLLLLAQVVILPGIDSPISELPFWLWFLAHEVYGLVLGGLFSINDYQ